MTASDQARPRCLYDVHREVRALFDRAGCRDRQDREALAEQLVGPGPYSLAQARRLVDLLRMALGEPKEEMTP